MTFSIFNQVYSRTSIQISFLALLIDTANKLGIQIYFEFDVVYFAIFFFKISINISLRMFKN